MVYKARPPRDRSLPPLKTKPRRCGIFHKDKIRRCDKLVDPHGKHFGPHHDSKRYTKPSDAWIDESNFERQAPTPERWYWT